MDESSYPNNQSKFKHPLVAELAWIIGSAPTMTDHPHKGLWRTLDNAWYEEQFREHLDWLYQLEMNPEPLQRFIGNERMLLGKRFEKLILFWLQESPFFEVILYSKQIVKGKNTIGEVDFLIKDVLHDRYLHMEVACKFYLGYGNSPSWDKWVGPNAKDRLKLKMDKLEQQLSLFDRPEGSALLQELRISKPEPVLLMKGYFFHHFTVIASHKNPKHANPKYPSGWYSKLGEVSRFPGDKGEWILLEKQSWLSPVHAPNEYKVIPGNQLQHEIEKLFSGRRRSVMLARVYEDNGILIEIDRGIVVNERWPAQ